MNCKFVADRITELRIKKGISEQKMSFELGHSGNYIQLISSGKMIPSLKEFFNICDFLEISPSLFFEDNMMVTDEETGEKKAKSIPYLINLVDSPGHIDFSSDVSAAV